MAERIGRNLRVARSIKDISRKQLERLSGVSSGTIKNIERVRQKPNGDAALPELETLVKLAVSLNVDVSDFLNPSGVAQLAARLTVNQKLSKVAA